MTAWLSAYRTGKKQLLIMRRVYDTSRGISIEKWSARRPHEHVTIDFDPDRGWRWVFFSPRRRNCESKRCKLLMSILQNDNIITNTVLQLRDS